MGCGSSIPDTTRKGQLELRTASSSASMCREPDVHLSEEVCRDLHLTSVPEFDPDKLIESTHQRPLTFLVIRLVSGSGILPRLNLEEHADSLAKLIRRIDRNLAKQGTAAHRSRVALVQFVYAELCMYAEEAGNLHADYARVDPELALAVLLTGCVYADPVLSERGRRLVKTMEGQASEVATRNLSIPVPRRAFGDPQLGFEAAGSQADVQRSESTMGEEDGLMYYLGFSEFFLRVPKARSTILLSLIRDLLEASRPGEISTFAASRLVVSYHMLRNSNRVPSTMFA